MGTKDGKGQKQKWWMTGGKKCFWTLINELIIAMIDCLGPGQVQASQNSSME